jgi:hypothetical protein
MKSKQKGKRKANADFKVTAELKVFKREVWSIDHAELTDEELQQVCQNMKLPYDTMLRLYHGQCSTVELNLLSLLPNVEITKITEEEAIENA